MCAVVVCSFNERVELILEHERGSGRERAQAMASEERELSDLFRRAEMDYEARLSSQVMIVFRGGADIPACCSVLWHVVPATVLSLRVVLSMGKFGRARVTFFMPIRTPFDG